MNETIEYYNRNAETFAAGTINADMEEMRQRFLKYVKAKGRILDAGCGTGRDSLAFINAGYAVDAFDASEEMCRYASDLLKMTVKCMRFEELSGENEYDGIWACASLLHVNAEDLPDVLTRINKLLKPDGVFYASFKSGSGERVKEGRYFNDMTAETCRQLFSESGFRILELFESKDVRPGRSEEWVNIIVENGTPDRKSQYY